MKLNRHLSTAMVGLSVFTLGAGAFAAETRTSEKTEAKTEVKTDSARISASPSETLAAYSPANGLSTETGSTAGLSSPLDQLYAGLTSTYHGSPLTHLGSEYTVDTRGREKRNYFNSVNFDSELGAGYRLTKDVGVGAIMPFLMVPVLGRGFVLGDVGVKVSDSKTIDWNGLRVSTNLMVQAPTSDYSSGRGMKWALKSTPAVRYSFARSNYSIGAFNELKDYFGVDSGAAFKLWTLPYADYSVNDSFSIRVAYEMEWHHDTGRKGLGFDTYATDLQPGVVFEVAKGVYLNPYLQFFTMDKVDMDHAAFGTFLSANLL